MKERVDPVTKHVRTMFDAYGETWGFQWRHNFGRTVRIDIPCTLARLFVPNTGEFKPKKYPEVFLGMGLAFSIVLHDASERDREMAFAHYVLEDVHVSRKASAMFIERSTYYQRLDAMRASMVKAVIGSESVDTSIWTLGAA